MGNQETCQRSPNAESWRLGPSPHESAEEQLAEEVVGIAGEAGCSGRCSGGSSLAAKGVSEGVLQPREALDVKQLKQQEVREMCVAQH